MRRRVAYLLLLLLPAILALVAQVALPGQVQQVCCLF